MYPSNGMGSQFRHFRNKEGSYSFEVNTWYRGTIDGKSMSLSSYSGCSVYTDVFTQIFDTSSLSATPDCKGGDFNKGCKIERPGGSTVNMGTGRLSHSQEVFSLTGSPLPLSVSLYYRSIPFAPGSIGGGWSHSYEATLQTGAGNSMVFWSEGTRRIYNKYSSSGPYVPPKGDHSTLVKNADNSWTITEPDGLKRNFDAAYRLTSIFDRYGNTLTFSYADNKLSSITDVNGRIVTFGYNEAGRLETITDPVLNVHTLGYTGTNLTSVAPPGDNGQWLYTYNPTNGLLETKKDPAGNISSYAYIDNRVKTATDPAQKPRVYSYDPTPGSAGKIPDPYPQWRLPEKQFVFTEKDGNGWSYRYDTRTMNVRAATDPLGKTTDYYYNPDGTLRAVTVPFDGTTRHTTFYTYDNLGNMLTRTDPVDLSGYTPAIDPQIADIAALASRTPPIRSAEIYTYDPANYYEIKTFTDNRGSSPLTTTYDRYSEPGGEGGALLVTRITSPGETVGTTLTSYRRQYADGQLASITDANGKTTSFTYYPVDDTTKADGTSGMLHTVTTPDDARLTITAYDKNGKATEFKLSDADGTDIPVRTAHGYDALNRITSVLRESTAAPARFSPILTTYGYDNNGNVASVIDAENRETRYEYSFDGQLKKISNTVSGLVQDTVLEYGGSGCSSCNGADKLTAVKDPNHAGNNLPGTIYQYDKAGRLEYETDPMGKKLRYTYYDNGLPKGKYDATGGDPGTLLISYRYNNRGQLTEKVYPDNTKVKFTYKPNGLLETANTLSGDAVTSGYTYEYHDNGRLKSVIDSNGRKIGYDEYDGIGQKKKVTILKGAGADERTINYDYDGANRPWHIVSAAGTFTFAYDKRGRRDILTYPNGTTADRDYDDLDRLTAITHRTTDGAVFASFSYPLYDKTGNIKQISGSRNETYLYDEIYRLTDTVTAKGTEKFTYDPAGNRKTGPGPKDTGYAYNDANQMTAGRNLAYTYDNMGNQADRIIPGVTDKSWSQYWDYENRLVKVEKIKGAERKTVTFKYDPFGRRIEKKLETVIRGVTKATTWTYLYDEEDIVLEIFDNGTGQNKTFYTHGPGIDEPLALERNGQIYFYHADHLGSIVAITDSARNVVQSYQYDSFGMVKASTGFINSYTFQGREWDPQIGLYYYRARYYDPLAGRFISKDPIGFAGGDLNLYGFVQNNPINWIDPDGFARKRGQTPPKRWPKPPKHLKPKWNKEGFYDCTNGRRLTWDDRSHGAGVDRGQGPQGGHWDDETSDNRWDENGYLLPGSPDAEMADTYVDPMLPFFPINPSIPALPGFSPVPIRVPIPVFGL